MLFNVTTAFTSCLRLLESLTCMQPRRSRSSNLQLLCCRVLLPSISFILTYCCAVLHDTSIVFLHDVFTFPISHFSSPILESETRLERKRLGFFRCATRYVDEYYPPTLRSPRRRTNSIFKSTPNPKLEGIS